MMAVVALAGSFNMYRPEGQVYLDLVLSLNLHSSKAGSCPSYECVFSIDAVREVQNQQAPATEERHLATCRLHWHYLVNADIDLWLAHVRIAAR